jgi:hypothetical protein
MNITTEVIAQQRREIEELRESVEAFEEQMESFDERRTLEIERRIALQMAQAAAGAIKQVDLSDEQRKAFATAFGILAASHPDCSEAILDAVDEFCDMMAKSEPAESALILT